MTASWQPNDFFGFFRPALGLPPGPSAIVDVDLNIIPAELIVDAPAHGAFIPFAGGDCDFDVSGEVPNVADIDLVVEIDGAPAATSDGFFDEPLSTTSQPFLPILIEAERVPTGQFDSRAARDPLRQQHRCRGQRAALRRRPRERHRPRPARGAINAAANTALGNIFDLIPNPVAINECIIDLGYVCVTELDRLEIDAASLGDLAINLNAVTNAVNVTGTATNLTIDYTAVLEGTIEPDCDGILTADSIDLTVGLALEPDGNPANIDINQVPFDPTVNIVNLSNDFNAGVCSFPIIEDIINLFLPNLVNLITPEIVDALDDPDNAGPQDAIIAQTLENQLAGLNIDGLAGTALGLDLTALFAAILEDNAGVTFELDGNVEPLAFPPGPPNLPASYSTTNVFPSFGANTPVGGVPYGVALGLHENILNKLLRAETLTGAFELEIAEFDLGLGGGPGPVSTLLLGVIDPAFATVSPPENVVIEITPSLAPVLSLNPGGNPVIDVAGMDVAIKGQTSGDTFVNARLDGQLDILDVDLVGSQLSFGPVAVTNFNLVFIDSPIGVSPAALTNPFLQAALANLNGSAICGTLQSIQVPSFLGFELNGVETEQTNGGFLNFYADLVAP